MPARTGEFVQQLELELRLLDNDAAWLKKLDNSKCPPEKKEKIVTKWSSSLEDWNNRFLDDHERYILIRIKETLDELKAQNTHLAG